MDIIPQAKKNVIMDATMLSSLMSCGRYYDIRFNHRLVSMRGKSNSLEIGSLIHKVFEVFYDHQIKGFPRATSIGQALAAGQLYISGCPHCANFVDDPTSNVAPACGHQAQEYPGLTNTAEENEKWNVGWQFALTTCELYFDHYKNDSFIPLQVEHVKKKVLYEDDELRVLWKAKLDLVIDTNQIGIVSMDHKTFKQRRDKTTLNNQFIGHCLLLDARNVIVNKIGLQSSLKIEDRLSRDVISLSADRLDEWKNQILPYYAYKFIDFAESEYWPPDYTHCDTMFGPCPYKMVCESDRGMREEVLRNEFQIAPVWDPTNRAEE